MSEFRFKQFTVRQDRAALKVGTDAVLLGAAMTLPSGPGSARLLDVGTGTGVIALMAAQRLLGKCFVTAIDIDAPSVEDARDNFAASPWSDCLEARCISLQDFASGSALFDCIFSNPPFYDNSLRNPSERESAARHTVNLSWREILSFASDHLRPRTGTLSLILPAEEEKALRRSAASFGIFPFRIVRIRTVATKSERRIVAELGFSRTATLREESLTLQEGSERSAAYSSLTEPFYL